MQMCEKTNKLCLELQEQKMDLKQYDENRS